MERIFNDDERLRRAEEIYYRRNHRNVSISKNDYIKPKTYLGSKILLEMLILLLLALIVFAIKNKDYIFTQDFLSSVSKYNVNLTQKLGFIKKYFEDGNTDQVFIKDGNENTTQETSRQNDANAKSQDEQTENNTVITQDAQSVVTDVNSLKNTINFIKPIDGIVSSGFGTRESKYQNISGEHTGIDIAADSRCKNKICYEWNCYTGF